MSGKNIRALKGHRLTVSCIAIDYDSKIIISGSWDKTIKIWDIQSGTILKTLLGHDDLVWSVAISHDSKFIVSASDDNTIRIWNILEKGTKKIYALKIHCQYVYSIAISTNGK